MLSTSLNPKAVSALGVQTDLDHSTLYASFLSACQRISFASLQSAKNRCSRGRARSTPTTFRGALFFPFLVSINVTQRTFGLVCVLVTINDAVVDAGVVFLVL
jgi:hypothetical protein